MIFKTKHTLIMQRLRIKIIIKIFLNGAAAHFILMHLPAIVLYHIVCDYSLSHVRSSLGCPGSVPYGVGFPFIGGLFCCNASV